MHDPEPVAVHRHLVDAIAAEHDADRRRVLVEDLVRALTADSDAALPASRDVAATAPADADLRVLAVHGIGDHHSDLAWQQTWTRAITDGVRRFAPGATVAVEFAMYDDIVASWPLKASTIAGAFAKLGASGVVHGIGDALSSIGNRIGGLFRSRGFDDQLRWTAGMVAQWADEDALRRQLRERVAQRIAETRPHLVLAHSLGSLVCYDAFSRRDGRGMIADRVFLTLGSQIGNPFVRSRFGGRVGMLPTCRRWWHLYNREDAAFAAPLRLHDARFRQVDTFFDIPGMLDHDAERYLRHEATIDAVWRDAAAIALQASLTRAPRGARPALRVEASAAALPAVSAAARASRPPRRRALLVGINEYPAESDRLEGCVNDVFLVSALLQETGFAPDEIRVVLDDRATAAGIRERIAGWLLDDVRPGDVNVLYYSGHGAQMPVYGADDEPDHKLETLVPWDFDWSAERAITDDWFAQLYGELPYDSRFLAIFDCCHSGGINRSGGARVRGLNPPDDIRHRALRWDAGLGMWTQRSLPAAGRGLAVRARVRADYVGKEGDLRRLGRAVAQRRLEPGEDLGAYRAQQRARGHKGPFLPVIIQSCGEDQLSYEYRHGVTSYGAFTFALQQVLRSEGGRGLSFTRLVSEVAGRLKVLGYEQLPQLVGPRAVIRGQVPWPARRGARRR